MNKLQKFATLMISARRWYVYLFWFAGEAIRYRSIGEAVEQEFIGYTSFATMDF